MLYPGFELYRNLVYTPVRYLELKANLSRLSRLRI